MKDPDFVEISSGVPDQRMSRVTMGLLTKGASAESRASLAARMAHYSTPGVSVAVIHDYRVEWASGFGVKHWGRTHPVTESTIFQAASLSKPIFALAVMRMVEAGVLDLDEDVNAYLTSWKVPPCGSWQPRVTLRQILSHTAGFTVHGFPGYMRCDPLPTLVDVLEGRSPANTKPVVVDILPGTQCRYSGGGTAVAQQVVMDVFGKPFPEIMNEWILQPLGMMESTWEQPLPALRWPSAATAHLWRNRSVDGRWHVYPEMAPAGLWSTPAELAQACIELQLALRGESSKLFSKKTALSMLESGVDPEVGLGFFFSGEGENVRMGHTGWNEGFPSKMTFFRDKGMGAIIMLNSNQGWDLLDEIERAIAVEYGWPGYFPQEKVALKSSSTLREACSGCYRTPTGEEFIVSEEASKLYLQVPGQKPVELCLEGGSHFFMMALEAAVGFEGSEDGEARRLSFAQSGKRIVAERVRSED
jgi:CubicO group peptidase (beta-lactamase class C family)